MTQPHHRVKIVIPVYRPVPTETERASIAQTIRQLVHYPIILLHPQGMDMENYVTYFPTAQTLGVTDEWLGTRNGIAGYNRMMLSSAFYELFADTEYLLICHSDAWIFGRDLESWCDRGYDCIAAPWVRRPIYNLPLIRQWMWLRRRLAERSGKPIRQNLYGRIGNGGLSLRRVAAFRDACERYRTEAERFAAEPHHLYNEDVFWATIPTEFRYPSWLEALGFAFDTNPAYCYRANGKRLPFGCHSWSKPRYWSFWKRFINW